MRDGDRAVELARQLISEEDGEPDPNHLDTLAAAHAASGDMLSAYQVQTKALRILERAGADPRQISAYRKTAETYRAERGRMDLGD